VTDNKVVPKGAQKSGPVSGEREASARLNAELPSLEMSPTEFDDLNLRYFDSIASDYDRIRGSEIWPSLLQTVTSFDHQGQPILDIATGTGLFSVELAARGFHVIGLDCSLGMLAHAIRKARQRRVSFYGILGSAERLPFLDKSFSVVFSTNAIHHFDIRAHFREMKRVLRPGGYYVVHTRFRKQNVKSICGCLFPKFAEKETRLYDPEDFERLDQEFPELVLESLDELSFKKPFSRSCLLRMARQRKYSTFAFYQKSEFWQAYEEFRSHLENWSQDFYVAEIARIVFRHRAQG